MIKARLELMDFFLDQLGKTNENMRRHIISNKLLMVLVVC